MVVPRLISEEGVLKMTSKEIKPNTKDVIESIDTVITIMERFGNMNALGV